MPSGKRRASRSPRGAQEAQSRQRSTGVSGPSAAASSAAPSSGDASATPRPNEPGSILWHFCDPKGKRSSAPTLAARPPPATQRAAAASEKQVSGLLELMQRGKRRQAGGGGGGSGSGDAEVQGASKKTLALGCWQRAQQPRTAGALAPFRRLGARANGCASGAVGSAAGHGCLGRLC